MQDRLALLICPWVLLCLSAGPALAQEGSAGGSVAGTTTTKQDIVGIGQSQQFGQFKIAVQSVGYGRLEWPPSTVGMTGGEASGILVTIKVFFVKSDSFQLLLQDATLVDTQGKTWRLTAIKTEDQVNEFMGPVYGKYNTSGSQQTVLLFECPNTVKPVRMEWKGLKPFGLVSPR
jgi:hypothetical protein